MTEIKLTQGYEALVDDCDAARVIAAGPWHAHRGKGGMVYAVREVRDPMTGKRSLVLMHRLILDAQPGEQVDHIHHNGCDNRSAGLRLCTQAQNSANMRKRPGTSQYKGVCWDKRLQKWRAQIMVNGRNHYLGCYASETAAARAYDAAARERFGEFACLNFPEVAP